MPARKVDPTDDRTAIRDSQAQGRRTGNWRVVLVAVFFGVVAAAAVGVRIGWHPSLPPYLFLVGVGTTVSVTDVMSGRIPNRVVLPAYPAGFALLVLPSALMAEWGAYAHAAIGVGVSLGIYFLLSCIRSGLGMGDVKLAGLLGSFLSFLGWDVYVSGLCAGFVLGALGMLALNLRRRVAPKRTMPFAPFMVVGAVIAIVVLG